MLTYRRVQRELRLPVKINQRKNALGVAAAHAEAAAAQLPAKIFKVSDHIVLPFLLASRLCTELNPFTFHIIEQSDEADKRTQKNIRSDLSFCES